MSDEGQLMKQDELPISKYADEEAFAGICGSGFIPRIQLMGGNSDIVKEGTFPIGHYALVTGRTHDDIGAEVISVILSWRPKAMDFEEMTECFNPKSKDFQEIKHKAETIKGPGYGFGPEFLIYLPEHKKLATYFCGNITARNESKIIIGYVGKVCLLKSRLIKGKKYTWHGPEVKACEVDVDVPDLTKLADVMNKFANPPEKELIEEEEEGKRD